MQEAKTDNQIHDEFEDKIKPICQTVLEELSELRKYFIEHTIFSKIEYNFSAINLRDLRLLNGDLSYSNFEFSNLHDAVLVKTNPSNSKLSGTQLTNINLQNSQLYKTEFSRVFLGYEKMFFTDSNDALGHIIFLALDEAEETSSLHIKNMDMRGCNLDTAIGLETSELSIQKVEFDDLKRLKE